MIEETLVANFTCDEIEDESRHYSHLEDYEWSIEESGDVKAANDTEFAKINFQTNSPLTSPRDILEREVELISKDFLKDGTIDRMKLLEVIEKKGKELSASFYDIDLVASKYYSMYVSNDEDLNNPQLDKMFRSRIFLDINSDNQATRVDFECMEIDKVNFKMIKSLFHTKEMWENYKSIKVTICPVVYDAQSKNILCFKKKDRTFCLNKWQPPRFLQKYFFTHEEIEKVIEIPKIYDQFFRHLTNGHEESYQFLIKWMAYSLKGRNPTMLGAIGAKGTGKNTVYEILSLIHGKSNSVKVRDEFLKGRFNAAIDGKTLLFIDEVHMDIKSRAQENKFKDLINDTLEVEPKNTDTKQITNFANVYFCSNHYDGVLIDANDRRFSLIELTAIPLRETSLKDTYSELFDDCNIDELGRFLYHYPVEREDVATPFISNTTFLVRDALRPVWEDWMLNDWIPKKMIFSRSVSQEIFNQDFQEKFPLLSPPGRVKIEEVAKNNKDLFRFTKRQGNQGRFFEFDPIIPDALKEITNRDQYLQ